MASASSRNRAVEACKHDWIFSLDADERCTKEVRDEILALMAADPPLDVYRVPRRNYMMGRWIKGSGWYPNFRQPQLFRKGSMRYTLEPVHEGYDLLNGKPLGTLKNAVWQFPFRNLEEVIKKLNRYSSLGVRKLAGKRVSMSSALGHGIWAFFKHYIFKRGFIDGWAGFVIALGSFEGTFYPLRQALRGNARLAAAGEQAAQARQRYLGLNASSARACARPWRWLNGRARCRSGSRRRLRLRRWRGRPRPCACSRCP